MDVATIFGILFGIMVVILFFHVIIVVIMFAIPTWLCIEALTQNQPLYILAAIFVIVVEVVLMVAFSDKEKKNETTNIQSYM